MLRFKGVICSGQGDFAKDHVITDMVLNSDPGWIKRIEQGTLNIKVDLQGQSFGSGGVRELDLNEEFIPHIYIDHDLIQGNTLSKRRTEKNNTGDGQFWRAELFIQATGHVENTYVLRRVDSGYRDRIELIASCHLRTELGLVDGDRVEVRVYSKNA